MKNLFEQECKSTGNKNRQMNNIKLKSSYPAEEIFNILNRQTTKWVKIFANYSTERN
jgi:hypothetical protein